jgi:hypothetical protein
MDDRCDHHGNPRLRDFPDGNDEAGGNTSNDRRNRCDVLQDCSNVSLWRIRLFHSSTASNLPLEHYGQEIFLSVRLVESR